MCHEPILRFIRALTSVRNTFSCPFRYFLPSRAAGAVPEGRYLTAPTQRRRTNHPAEPCLRCIAKACTQQSVQCRRLILATTLEAGDAQKGPDPNGIRLRVETVVAPTENRVFLWGRWPFNP